ncbi:MULTISPECIES: glutaminase B [unclassified Pseudomonas]|uniref:glutaminase B n=1 Tax=unclassified Pseudomonas TaxID=196821 RepID=UPI000BDC8F14|nr:MULTISPECIES: glutaminase B [unclassified Pseudomonas]PVZ19843.1 L-glutaminase [Pseudomonas sp. URIL14HWK12:I12]PVZ26909.1 L-glutaminase [Pseudomonas sp. URIL14HWK12:I10]PVZ37798.1 L-glutaminase [Pseudomonas sp. URIL14HWK12:I11]SNZ05626.1 L-glutaminase [Pseudomonas sp. URIL14HWK12:I9]
MQALLDDILEQVRPLIGQGHVATYIPALAKVPPGQLGIAVQAVDGQAWHAGDANTPFSIQSISKVFSLVQAIQHSGEEIWARLGHEPSGQAFNSMVQLEFERGRPRNPFINAGALVICDINQSRFAAPTLSMRDFVRRLSGNGQVVADAVVAESEYQHRARNAAMAWLMQSFGNFHNDVDAVLRSYFHHCALAISCQELARAFAFLANRGACPHTGEQVLTPRQTQQVNAIMATSGLYDEAGNFAYRVGLPGKSGVGGGILAVVPGRYTVCVWSPELNASGNSLAGMAALERFSDAIGASVFARS